MSQLLSVVVPLSLGAAVSPTVLCVVVLTLSGKVAPRARAWAETLGFTLALVVVTALLLLLARFIVGVKPDPRVLGSFDLAAAVVLLYLGVRDAFKLASHGEQEKRQAHARTAATGPELPAFIGIGAALLVTDVTSLVLYIPALKEILKASIPAAEKVAVALIPFFAVVAPAVIPSALASVAPGVADRVLTPLNSWVTKHQRVIGMVVCFVFGAYLLWKGWKGLGG
jgi:threonine/homoserine/homoserine lactone efflux protein